MHIHNTAPHQHKHIYFSGHEYRNERRTWWVVGLTAVMMMVEITCGTAFNSMALLADGWHMSTHVGALGIAAFAYFFARKQAQNPRFTFGTGKVGALGGFTSAIILAMVALLVTWESVARFIHPLPIVYDEAIGIAFAGFCVNIISAWMLSGDHSHDHPHSHDHSHAHHHDHNLRAAYMHVLADAFTSVLAIIALLLGKYCGLIRMDAVMGMIGSLVIANWSVGLLRQTSGVLLDNLPDTKLEAAIRGAIERDADNQVTDLHVWNIAPNQLSVIVSLVTDAPKPPHYYKALLGEFHSLAHITVEVNKCE